MVWVCILGREHPKVNRKWFYWEAENRTCDPWFTRHSNELVLLSFLLGVGFSATYKYKPVCYHKHWLFYAHPKVIFRKSLWHLRPTLEMTSPTLNIFWILQFKSVCIQSSYINGTFLCVSNGKKCIYMVFAYQTLFLWRHHFFLKRKQYGRHVYFNYLPPKIKFCIFRLKLANKLQER